MYPTNQRTFQWDTLYFFMKIDECSHMYYKTIPEVYVMPFPNEGKSDLNSQLRNHKQNYYFHAFYKF